MGNNHSLPFLKGELIHNVICEDVSNLGYGVFKVDNVVIFAKGVITGERVDLRIQEVKKKFAIANVVKIIEASEARIKSNSKYRKQSNAYRYLEFTYEKQIEIKEQQMTELFNREVEVQGANHPFMYRNKSEFFYNNERLNMYGENDQLVAIDQSILSHQKINDLLDPVLEAINNNKRANVSSVIFRYSEFQDKMMIILVSEIENKYHLKIAQEIVGYSPIVSSVVLNLGKSKNYLFNDTEKVLYGDSYLIDCLMNKEFKITSKSFYQINQRQTEKLYKTALAFGDFKETDNIADLYCGVGTIGIIASDYVNHVLGVEVVPEAVLAAKENIELNEVRNYDVIEHDLNEDMSILENIDGVIVDPPRNGLSEILINNLANAEIKKIVYISCNPYTQKRDLERFERLGYKMEKISAVDMFSYTEHVESVILITKI